MLEKITIRVDKGDWEKFKKIATEKGFNASSVLRNFIKEYIEKNRGLLASKSESTEDRKR
jgi:predicted DNA binding CopG/RHH family protein